MARRPKGKDNYLDFIPVRNIEHEEGQSGLLILLRPKFMRGPLESAYNALRVYITVK